jgi:hypothetical protein
MISDTFGAVKVISVPTSNSPSFRFDFYTMAGGKTPGSCSIMARILIRAAGIAILS